MISVAGLAVWITSVTATPLTSSDITSDVKGQVVTAGASYQGYVDKASGWEFYLGVRYAAKPQRWQAPTSIDIAGTSVVQANVYGAECFQSQPNAIFTTAQASTIDGSEDCLFANIWRPTSASLTGKLPVLFWIHGGGYGSGNGQADPTFFSQVTGNMNFVFVAIQYRLGAFGFLSSQAVHDGGVVNAGLLDQNMALNWVQQHISSFGGDPTQVTIWGESAGAGSVMQHLVAYGGSLNTSLFNSAMLASPYLPSQYEYNDSVPTALYEQLATRVGCSGTNTFQCLSAVSGPTLALAGDTVSRSAPYGTWGFAPVVDGQFSQQTPTAALLAKRTNGNRVLIGNNAAEGMVFTPQNITTSAQVLSYVENFFPTLSSSEFTSMLKIYYPEPLSSGCLYATQLERAARIYGDVTFDCPGNMIADSFSQSWRYKYAVANSYHGLDVPAYLPSGSESLPATDNLVSTAFDNFLNTFVVGDNPYINTKQALPLWQSTHQQAIIDTTGGIVLDLPIVYAPIEVPIPLFGIPVATLQSGLRTTNSNVDRCAFWASVASKISI